VAFLWNLDHQMVWFLDFDFLPLWEELRWLVFGPQGWDKVVRPPKNDCLGLGICMGSRMMRVILPGHYVSGSSAPSGGPGGFPTITRKKIFSLLILSEGPSCVLLVYSS